MTDKTKYRNVSLSHYTHNNLVKIAKHKAKRAGLVNLSIASTIQSITQEVIDNLYNQENEKKN